LLLPPRLEAARCAVLVADPLTVKGRPGCSPRARPRELAKADLIWQRTGVLAHYLTGLRPGLLAGTGFYADPRNRGRTTHVYPLADLAYSVCFSEHDGELFAHIRLNVFSDLGGAGVSVINGTVVKVRKGAGTYDEEELADRAAFQRGYPLPLIVSRVTRRNLRRLTGREPAPDGPFGWGRAFFSKKSVLANAVRKYVRNRGRYASQLSGTAALGVRVLRFRTPGHAEQWLSTVAARPALPLGLGATGAQE